MRAAATVIACSAFAYAHAGVAKPGNRAGLKLHAGQSIAIDQSRAKPETSCPLVGTQVQTSKLNEIPASRIFNHNF